VFANVSRPRALSTWGTLRGAYICKAEHDRPIIGTKPLALLRALVRDYTLLGDLVVDPYAGSGTTLLAAAMEGRRAIGAECSPEHYEIACKRLQRGYTPTLGGM
jgi:DNA modification methylase